MGTPSSHNRTYPMAPRWLFAFFTRSIKRDMQVSWLGKGRLLADYFVPCAAAAGTFVLGGETAVPGGECAPDASSGLELAAVTGV